jgi:hypothetical protein
MSKRTMDRTGTNGHPTAKSGKPFAPAASRPKTAVQPHVIHPAAVYAVDEAQAALRLRDSTLLHPGSLVIGMDRRWRDPAAPARRGDRCLGFPRLARRVSRRARPTAAPGFGVRGRTRSYSCADTHRRPVDSSSPSARPRWPRGDLWGSMPTNCFCYLPLALRKTAWRRSGRALAEAGDNANANTAGRRRRVRNRP